MRTGFKAVLLAGAILWGERADGADFTLKTATKEPPKEISDSIRAVLQSNAIQLVKDDKPALEIWLRQEVPLKSKPASASEALMAIAETTLVGVVAVSEPSLRDYKDNAIPKGVYTVRFAVQPKDGDHLGTAEFDSFVILTDVQNDKDLNGLNTFRSLTRASGKSSATGHPLVASLRPPGSGSAPALTEPAEEHKAVRLKVPAKPSGGEKTDLVFELVYRGHGHIQ